MKMLVSERNMFFKFRRKWSFTSFILLLLLPSLIQTSSPKASKLTPSSDLLTSTRSQVVAKNCDHPCGNGVCNEETRKCDCFPGWRGDKCDLCGGKIKLNATKGWLADAVGNYTVDSKCTWLIEAPNDDDRIRLHIKDFATECGWDHLYIFDGNSVFSDLRGVYSGIIRQDRYQIHAVPELVGKSGSMLLHFYSDVAYNMTGFNITFSINDCPSERFDVTCSRHGSCDTTTGRCHCDEDFKGEACSIPACPDNCKDKNGVARGTCNKREKKCDCFSGWTGVSCSQSIAHGYWKVLSSTQDNTFAKISPAAASRTSHAAMVDAWGKMWVVGGEMFGSADTMGSGRLVATYRIPNVGPDDDAGAGGKWHDIRFNPSSDSNSKKTPNARYGHSAVIHDQKIYMYGGTMKSGHTSRELWALDLDLLSWERVDWKNGQCMSQGEHKLCGPIHSMGHTATVVASRMIVIFGHSPKYGYLDTVQEYHFGNKEWSIIPTKGYPVRGGFGHSAVLDELTNVIYVFGGYTSTHSTSSSISNELYSYDPITRIWRRHAASSSFRYLHSAVALHGIMIVFGGNTHNDTSFSQGAKCYSADLLFYDMICDKWINSQDILPKDLDADLARFGHSAVVYKDMMLIHGGFHGKLKNDVIAFVPGDCGIYKSKKECLSSRAGVKCVWDIEKTSCRMLSADTPKSDNFDMCELDTRDSDNSGFCKSLDTCSACMATTSDCVWCGDSCEWKECFDGELSEGKRLDKSAGSAVALQNVATSLEQCSESDSTASCSRHQTCHSCSVHGGCTWQMDKTAKCKETSKKKKATGNLTDEPGQENWCNPACSDRTTCSNCTHGICMWCKNLHLCIDRNAYLASFPYGQCMEWTTQSDGCPVPNKNESLPDDICLGYRTCDSCHSNPSCGWCDSGTKGGIGTCMLGGATGPMEKVSHNHGHYEWKVDQALCPVEEGQSWHFTTCPACQCNGHSFCTKEEGVCDQPCADNTEGDHCERCSDGYFGNPVNGGTCEPCKCNNQASSCNHRSGRCYCTTKGIIGEHCEKCDKANQYHGDPTTGSCFYELTIDYQFTFNLSKADDKHFTAINFNNKPKRVNVDVDFSIKCSVPAKLNVTYKYSPSKSKEGQETVLYTGINCTEFKDRFTQDQYHFGQDQNTTFYVYVYDVQPPLWIIISFSQHATINLLQFFVTFSSCFLALLVVAAILWKIKQRYDRYRRRQRLFVEMEQMASRPFGSVLVELENHKNSSSHQSNSATTCHITGNEDQEATSVVRKRKTRYRPSPIALEPCEGNKAAVLSLIVKLPTGGKPYAPPGYTGIAVASSLVTLGNQRKPSTDNSNKQMDDPKSGRKGRKGPNVQPTDI